MTVVLVALLLSASTAILVSSMSCADLGLISGGHPTVFEVKSSSGNSPQTSHITWETTGTVRTTLTSSVSCKVDGDSLVISSTGIPAHNVGDFPMHTSTTGEGHPDNPNAIQQQAHIWAIPVNPVKKAGKPASIINDFSALPMGPIGFALNGVPFFNLYNKFRLDAVSRNSSGYEVMDLCHGHPDRRGVYHYHYQIQSDGCLFGVSGAQINVTVGKRSPKIGYALDGIPIYGPVGEGDKVPTDLDECNGRFDTELNQYIYHTTDRTIPYVIGCYRYKPLQRTVCSPVAQCPNMCHLSIDSNGCHQCRCSTRPQMTEEQEHSLK
jgi:hypothetical protein